MNDLLTQPYIQIGSGKNKLFKFKDGKGTYTEEEFKALLKQNIEETCKNDIKPKTKRTNKKDNKTE